VDTFTGAAEQAQHLGRTLAGAAEPVWLRGVELDRLPVSKDDVLLAQQQAHPAREDAEPLIAVVRPRVWGRLGGRMMIFHAWMPPGGVNGRTVRPFTRCGLSRIRGSPTSGAPTRSSNGTR